eukprot:CFRG0053T1
MCRTRRRDLVVIASDEPQLCALTRGHSIVHVTLESIVKLVIRAPCPSVVTSLVFVRGVVPAHSATRITSSPRLHNDFDSSYSHELYLQNPLLLVLGTATGEVWAVDVQTILSSFNRHAVKDKGGTNSTKHGSVSTGETETASEIDLFGSDAETEGGIIENENGVCVDDSSDSECDSECATSSTVSVVELSKLSRKAWLVTSGLHGYVTSLTTYLTEITTSTATLSTSARLSTSATCSQTLPTYACIEVCVVKSVDGLGSDDIDGHIDRDVYVCKDRRLNMNDEQKSFSEKATAVDENDVSLTVSVIVIKFPTRHPREFRDKVTSTTNQQLGVLHSMPLLTWNSQTSMNIQKNHKHPFDNENVTFYVVVCDDSLPPTNTDGISNALDSNFSNRGNRSTGYDASDGTNDSTRQLKGLNIKRRTVARLNKPSNKDDVKETDKVVKSRCDHDDRESTLGTVDNHETSGDASKTQQYDRSVDTNVRLCCSEHSWRMRRDTFAGLFGKNLALMNSAVCILTLGNVIYYTPTPRLISFIQPTLLRSPSTNYEGEYEYSCRQPNVGHKCEWCVLHFSIDKIILLHPFSPVSVFQQSHQQGPSDTLRVYTGIVVVDEGGTVVIHIAKSMPESKHISVKRSGTAGAISANNLKRQAPVRGDGLGSGSSRNTSLGTNMITVRYDVHGPLVCAGVVNCDLYYSTAENVWHVSLYDQSDERTSNEGARGKSSDRDICEVRFMPSVLKPKIVCTSSAVCVATLRDIFSPCQRKCIPFVMVMDDGFIWACEHPLQPTPSLLSKSATGTTVSHQFRIKALLREIDTLSHQQAATDRTVRLLQQTIGDNNMASSILDTIGRTTKIYLNRITKILPSNQAERGIEAPILCEIAKTAQRGLRFTVTLHNRSAVDLLSGRWRVAICVRPELERYKNIHGDCVFKHGGNEGQSERHCVCSNCKYTNVNSNVKNHSERTSIDGDHLFFTSQPLPNLRAKDGKWQMDVTPTNVCNPGSAFVPVEVLVYLCYVADDVDFDDLSNPQESQGSKFTHNSSHRSTKKHTHTQEHTFAGAEYVEGHSHVIPSGVVLLTTATIDVLDVCIVTADNYMNNLAYNRGNEMMASNSVGASLNAGLSRNSGKHSNSQSHSDKIAQAVAGCVSTCALSKLVFSHSPSSGNHLHTTKVFSSDEPFMISLAVTRHMINFLLNGLSYIDISKSTSGESIASGQTLAQVYTKRINEAISCVLFPVHAISSCQNTVSSTLHKNSNTNVHATTSYMDLTQSVNLIDSRGRCTDATAVVLTLEVKENRFKHVAQSTPHSPVAREPPESDASVGVGAGTEVDDIGVEFVIRFRGSDLQVLSAVREAAIFRLTPQSLPVDDMSDTCGKKNTKAIVDDKNEGARSHMCTRNANTHTNSSSVVLSLADTLDKIDAVERVLARATSTQEKTLDTSFRGSNVLNTKTELDLQTGQSNNDEFSGLATIHSPEILGALRTLVDIEKRLQDCYLALRDNSSNNLDKNLN